MDGRCAGWVKGGSREGKDSNPSPVNLNSSGVAATTRRGESGEGEGRGPARAARFGSSLFGDSDYSLQLRGVIIATTATQRRSELAFMAREPAAGTCSTPAGPFPR